jgi:hypothetical protein
VALAIVQPNKTLSVRRMRVKRFLEFRSQGIALSVNRKKCGDKDLNFP